MLSSACLYRHGCMEALKVSHLFLTPVGEGILEMVLQLQLGPGQLVLIAGFFKPNP